MNVLFYAILLFMILCGIYGYCRGLIKMIYSVSAFIIASVVMIIFAPYVSNQFKNFEPLTSRIQEPLKETIQQKLDEGTNLDEILKGYAHLTQKFSDSSGLSTEQLAGEAALSVTNYICEVAAYVFLFLVIRIVLAIAAKALNIFEKLPVINTMNRLGGLALGIIESMGCVWLFFMLVDICSATKAGIKMLEMIDQNAFLSGLYQNNLFMKFF